MKVVCHLVTRCAWHTVHREKRASNGSRSTNPKDAGACYGTTITLIVSTLSLTDT
jgi:hypothetical protein